MVVAVDSRKYCKYQCAIMSKLIQYPGEDPLLSSPASPGYPHPVAGARLEGSAVFEERDKAEAEMEKPGSRSYM